MILGLLKLNETQFTDIKPVSIPTAAQIAKVNKLTKFKMYGWGQDQNEEVCKVPTHRKS